MNFQFLVVFSLLLLQFSFLCYTQTPITSKRLPSNQGVGGDFTDPGSFNTLSVSSSPYNAAASAGGGSYTEDVEKETTENVPRTKLWSPLSRSIRRSSSWSSTRIISTTQPTARQRDDMVILQQRSQSFPTSAASKSEIGAESESSGRDSAKGLGARSLIGNTSKLSPAIHTSTIFGESERGNDVESVEEEDIGSQSNEAGSWLISHPSPPRQKSQRVYVSASSTSTSPHQYQPHKDGERKSRGGDEKRREEEEAAGPIISSIRHHKSRKSFTRTRKAWKGGKNMESTQSVFTLLNEEQADEAHPENDNFYIHQLTSSTPSTVTKKAPYTHHSFPSHHLDETYGTFIPASHDNDEILQQASRKQEEELNAPREGIGRKMAKGTKGLAREKEKNSAKNREMTTDFIPATNDSQLVYGQPYFTPNRKRNSTRMQRIKSILRNSTEDPKKIKETFLSPTQPTLRGKEEVKVGESSFFEKEGEAGFKGSKTVKGSKSRERSKNNNPTRRKTTPHSGILFSPSESPAQPTLVTNSFSTPSTFVLPHTRHYSPKNVEQPTEETFASYVGNRQAGTTSEYTTNYRQHSLPHGNLNYDLSMTHNPTQSPPASSVTLSSSRSKTKQWNNNNNRSKQKYSENKATGESATLGSPSSDFNMHSFGMPVDSSFGLDELSQSLLNTSSTDRVVGESVLKEGSTKYKDNGRIQVWSEGIVPGSVSEVPPNLFPHTQDEVTAKEKEFEDTVVSSEMFPASGTGEGAEEEEGRRRWSDRREGGEQDEGGSESKYDYTLLGSDEEKIVRSGLDGPVDTFPPVSHLTDGDSMGDESLGEESGGSMVDNGVTTAPGGGVSGSNKARPDIDIVTKFLRIVETQHTLGDNCTAGTAFSLGEGVVDRYAQERFRLEANVAVNRANMLTRLWKYAEVEVMNSEYLLHASLFSMIEFDDDIFAAGNCYDKLEYKNYTLFCPFAYRLPEGNILVKDLAVEYKYLSNSSEWFYIARKNAQTVIKNFNQFSRGFNSYTFNESTHTDRIDDEILNVTYEDGKWSKPYFDCGGGNIWMMTYTVPFFGYKDGHYHFKGTSGIDIDLRRVDIDQCPLPENSTELNIFAASDKCKNATTKCVPIKGLGFRRGSYRCECQVGFYFPNVSSPLKFFNGTVLEEEYEKKLLNDLTLYDQEGAFECLRCPVGCDFCEDDRPCVVTLNWLMRSAILILQCAIIAMLPIVGLFTWKYSDIKVVRAASPVLLRFIVLGAFFIYCTILVMYPSPSVITCTLRVWLREIGFSLAYGALMLKTWRISVIFRVRSAKAVKITDLDLMKRLGIIVAMFTALLVIRTLVAPPVSIVSLTADDLKAWLCKSDWWDHSFTIMELMFLVWGIRLCIVVRKAPSEFNESKFISLAIYNEFLLSVFLNISMLFLQSPANPDLLYIIFFCHVQLTMTLLLCLIFGSKAYMVFRGHGKGNSSDETRVPTFISKNRSGQKPKQQSGHNSTTGVHSSTTSTSHALEANFPNNSRLSEDVQLADLDVVEWVNLTLTVEETLQSHESTEEEFRRLYYQLEELKERNMRLGNRHLVAKITAMQEAADNILGGSSGETSRHCGGEGRREYLDKSSSSSQPIDSISMTTMGASVCAGGGGASILSDITEEDIGCTKRVKRESFLSRVRSSKRLLSIRSNSGGESSKKTKDNKDSKSEPSSSSMVQTGGATGSPPWPESSCVQRRARNSNKAVVVRKLSQCDVAGASSGSAGGGTDKSEIVVSVNLDSDERGLAHGGVYIGPSDSHGSTSTPPRPTASANSNPKTEHKEGSEEEAQVTPGPEPQSSSPLGPGHGVHILESTTCINNPLESQVAVAEEPEKGRREGTSCDVEGNGAGTGDKGDSKDQWEVKAGSKGNKDGQVLRSDGGKGKGRERGRGVKGSSSDTNHTPAEGSKILLDLNDKSRFTEEITV